MCVVWFGLMWDASYVGQAGLELDSCGHKCVPPHLALGFLFCEVCFVFVF